MDGLTMTTTALPAQDLERARSFYRDVLGLEPAEVVEGGQGLLYRAGATEFLVFTSAGAPSGSHTQMALHVEDVDATAAELRSRGLTFEEIEGLEQVDGIADLGDRRGGWFRDSEGNLLGLVQAAG